MNLRENINNAITSFNETYGKDKYRKPEEIKGFLYNALRHSLPYPINIQLKINHMDILIDPEGKALSKIVFNIPYVEKQRWLWDDEDIPIESYKELNGMIINCKGCKTEAMLKINDIVNSISQFDKTFNYE